MKYETRSLDSFLLVGLSVRTNNTDGRAQKDIGNLWQRFMQDKIYEQIQNKLFPEIYCLYTEYESDYRGDYTCYIGCVVSQEQEGLDSVLVPTSQYYKFEEKGDALECVGKIWNHIWSSDYDRTYIADFDIYQANAFIASETEIRTYISIK